MTEKSICGKQRAYKVLQTASVIKWHLGVCEIANK